MLLRICLIVAILGAGAVVAVNFVMVKPAIETVIGQRNDETTAKKDAQGKLEKTQRLLTTASNTLTPTTKTLAATKTELDAAKNKAQALEATNTDLAEGLKKTTANNEKLQQQMNQWEILNLTPSNIVALQERLKKVTAAFDGSEGERQLISAKLKDTQDELDRLRGTNNVDQVPPLPPGLKGQVVAVDPKFGFVILNIGEDKGVLANGIMMVARGGNLIGKVQIARVDKTQSVANILPAWRRGEVMEGDEVLY